MVPVVDQKTAGGVVYLYDALSPRGNKRFAFKSIRFRNPTEKFLEAGKKEQNLRKEKKAANERELAANKKYRRWFKVATIIAVVAVFLCIFAAFLSMKLIESEEEIQNRIKPDPKIDLIQIKLGELGIMFETLQSDINKILLFKKV